MTIDGQKAVISYDPDIEMFRGEFLGLTGYADFYAKDIDGLKKEGAISLKVYLDSCKENGFKPFKSWSGKFNVRLTPEMHQLAATEAASAGISLNELVKNAMAAYLQTTHQQLSVMPGK